MKRKNLYRHGLLAWIACALLSAGAFAQDGKALYKKCAGCHSIGKGNKKGPDLEGISNKRSQEWLIKFIQSSKTMVNNGDADAIAIYKEYKNSPMKDFKLTDDEVKAILAYIDVESGGGDAGAASPKEEIQGPVQQPEEPSGPEIEALKQKIDSLLAVNSKESIAKGRDLFTGKTKFQNNAIACVACHSLTDRENINGGLLSVDLTKTFTESGGHDGINSIVFEPPSPAMEVAYKDHVLTPEEAVFIQLYLQEVEKANPVLQPVSYGILPASALKVLVLLILLITGIWYKRKRRSVNYSIIKRQGKYSK